MPPVPKRNPARRNRSVTKATLPREHDVQAPSLPERLDDPWHPMTVEWWSDIWASPMAPEFEKSDSHGLFILAALVDSFWYRPSQAVAAEIRLQRQCFGLTPIDRRRLQWEIEKVDEAQDRGAKRRAKKEPQATDEPAVDPRTALRAV